MAPPRWLIGLLLLLTGIGVRGDVVLRSHEYSEARNFIPTPSSLMNSSGTAFINSSEHDIISLENHNRNYRHGPNNNQYILFNHDLIAAYVGPAPLGHPSENYSSTQGIIRTWAMFDSRTKRYCDLNGVLDWGEVALFSCPHEGLYRAYSVEMSISGMPPGTIQGKTFSGKHVLAWTSKSQRDVFDLISGLDIKMAVFSTTGAFTGSGGLTDPYERLDALSAWVLGEVYSYVTITNNALKMPPQPVVISDPIRIKGSNNCYYWMYNLNEVAREGYQDQELVHTLSGSSTKQEPWTAYILLELSIWIAEPSAVGFHETFETNKVLVSDYSKVITKRFSKAGLFPCLRKAHSAIEVTAEIVYVSEVDGTGYMYETPHWKAMIKIHTDRLISTLSDITFTISSRQNTASFHCFVGDTRVFYKLRNFEFVKVGQLQPEHVKLNVSNLLPQVIHDFKFGKTKVFGHEVHHIGYKWSKKYQPASQRTDMMVITNPCSAQEFAFSVGGSMYIAQELLRHGTSDAQKVVLPQFPVTGANSNRTKIDAQEYLRVFDVAFTPTHVAFLMKDTYIVLHPSNPKVKGIADISKTQKYRVDAFVKRRWCPRTVSHKLSAQMLPIFGETGDIIILQIYPSEGNVPMWMQPLSKSCSLEAAGFVKKVEDQNHLINETDIHYEEYAKVTRTHHITGLVEPPVPSRPPPPPPQKRDIFEETSFIMDSAQKFIEEGEDPHFPHQLINPASHMLENNLKDFNQANIYVVENDVGLRKLLTQNGLTLTSSTTSTSDFSIAAVEFTAAEKQFIFAISFRASEITDAFQQQQQSEPPLQVVISTITLTNFPYRVKLDGMESGTDDKLDVVVPFPGGILIRMNHYQVKVPKSRDPEETNEHQGQLNGKTLVPFVPEIYTLGTAIPAYVINLGNVLVYSSTENRYARPLHYYPWDVLDVAQRTGKNSTNVNPAPLVFSDSSIRIGDNTTLYDLVVTEHGLISVLRRKEKRHLVQDDETCIVTPDTETQKVIMGSVITLEALREVKPFFRNDNIFQLGTPEGEIIYGVYDVKPRSSFESCQEGSTLNDTESDTSACIEQANTTLSKNLIPVCSKEYNNIDVPCRDPGYLQVCNSTVPSPTHACLRVNKACSGASATRHEEKDIYTKPTIADPGKCDTVDDKVALDCLPKHAPREDVRTVHILGTSYHSYLQGSLEDVKSIHPESLPWEGEQRTQEPDICPFLSFEIYHQQLDFAEVGYQTRLTAEVNYFGTGVPTEADLIVEFERTIGIVIEVSSSLEEARHLTTIRKTVDINFAMTDFMLNRLQDVDPTEKHNIRQNDFSFEDARARDPFSVFSITFRPSIVNTRCRNSDFFKTIHFNVGCNSFSKLRLLSEATPLKRINWTEYLDDTGFKWIRDEKNWKLMLPKQHIYYQQLRKGVFSCNNDTGYCHIPYYHLFKNEIYSISYRDLLVPKFEEFLTVSSRAVTGNVVLYDMLGSKEFNWTLNKLDAGCYNTEHFWYDKLLEGTKHVNNETFEHENVYLYYKDCFSRDENEGEREHSQNLYVSPFYLFNGTNKNTIKFLRKRNQLFIFRAVVLNTYYNRFTYCKYLDTYFMVRVTGIPIPRQGLKLWLYITIFISVLIALIISYVFFSKFYSGISTTV